MFCSFLIHLIVNSKYLTVFRTKAKRNEFKSLYVINSLFHRLENSKSESKKFIWKLELSTIFQPGRQIDNWLLKRKDYQFLSFWLTGRKRRTYRMVPGKGVHQEVSAPSAKSVAAIPRSNIAQTSAADRAPVEKAIRSRELGASRLEAIIKFKKIKLWNFYFSQYVIPKAEVNVDIR